MAALPSSARDVPASSPSCWLHPPANPASTVNPPASQMAPARPVPPPAAENADIRRLERELSEIVGAAIAIEHKAGGKGRMVINYASLDQLDGILRYFRPEAG